VLETPSPGSTDSDPVSGKVKDGKEKKDSSSGDDSYVPLPTGSDDLPAPTDGESELNRGLRQRIERGRPLPPGIERRLDEPADTDPLPVAP
jgi:hypothetical protein